MGVQSKIGFLAIVDVHSVNAIRCTAAAPAVPLRFLRDLKGSS